MLHVDKRDKANADTERPKEPLRPNTTASKEACGCVGVGSELCLLSILPVQIKSIKRGRVIQTYAFLDPGSSATFYSEHLMQRLGLSGKQTHFLLQTVVSSGSVWYLLHHGVYHPRKRSLRVVFDCGATFKGTSLNQQLLQGPNLTSTLFGALLRFRLEPVAVMGDIQAMFHQVRVAKEDRDFLRFVWWPEGDLTKKVAEFRMTVHLFGAVSFPSCASFALRKKSR